MRNKKFISLLCAAAMTMTMVPTFAFAEEEGTTTETPVATEEVVVKPTAMPFSEAPEVIENAPLIETVCTGIEGKVATFEVRYSGLSADDPVNSIGYEVKSSENIDLSRIEVVDAAKYPGALSNDKDPHHAIIGWAAATGTAEAGSTFAKFTATVKEDLDYTQNYELEVFLSKTSIGTESGAFYIREDGNLNYNIPQFTIEYVEVTPEPTPTPDPTPTPTAAPTLKPRPTYVPAATPTPEPTEDPDVTPKPTAAPFDEAPATIEGAPMMETVCTGIEGKVATFEVRYSGLSADDPVNSIGYEVTSPENVVLSKIEVVDAAKFPGALSNDKDPHHAIIGWAAATGTAEAGATFAKFTATVTEDLDYTQNYELKIFASKTTIGTENGAFYIREDGNLNYNNPQFTIEYVEPTPVPTETPVTPEPTVEPTIKKDVPLTDMVNEEKVKGEEEAAKDGETVYVALTVTDSKGNPLTYGKDYVVKKDGVTLTENEMNGILGAYNGKVSDALKDLTLVAYADDVKATAQVSKVGADGEGTVIEETENTVVKPAGKPQTTKATWKDNSGKTITSLSVVKGNAKVTYVEFAKEGTVEYSIKDEKVAKIASEGKNNKVTIEGVKTGSTTLTATLTAEDGTVETATLTVKVTSAPTINNNGGSSSGASTGSSATGSIAGGNLGGVSITKPNASKVVNFTDLNQAAWAKDAIVYLAERGIINGRSATIFDPNASITRAEFAQLVINIYGLGGLNSAATTSNFTDVAQGDWYFTAVNLAAGLGIVTGYPDGTFGPNNLISRQEMAVMMHRVAAKANIKLPVVNAQKTWADEVGAWATQAVTELQMAGVINGTSETTFEATAGATRAQAAQMIYNLYNVIK